jgi:hypothetical protein
VCELGVVNYMLTVDIDMPPYKNKTL